MTGTASSFVGRVLARYLTRKLGRAPTASSPPSMLQAALRPGDVLLVEGDTRISVAIKYLTQSTWSHAALYVGPRPELPRRHGEVVSLIEADLIEGVRALPLSEYAQSHTRICRPVGLRADDRARLIEFMILRIGRQYDLKNVIDLARYLIRTPPVPTAWRRRMIALGSGDPTRAICSTLIAQAFQSIGYPILPEISREDLHDPDCRGCTRELLHIRHHSLFAPRDFDVSPFFAVVKPRLVGPFDYISLVWARDDAPPGARTLSTEPRSVSSKDPAAA